MESIQLAAGAINWNGGQRITLHSGGDPATCTNLVPGQLYGIFAYNSAQNDNTANLSVAWSNSQPPVTLKVPGTTGNAGLAAVGFLSGTDTQTVSVSLPTGSDIAQVDVWLGSVSMPINTAGLNNKQLPADGVEYPFDKYTRYYAVPASKWYALALYSPVTQFIACQFREQKAIVFVLNETSNGLLPGQVINIGPTASAAGTVTINATTIQRISSNLQGDGTQWVWMNADSQQNSDASTISLQALS